MQTPLSGATLEVCQVCLSSLLIAIALGTVLVLGCLRRPNARCQCQVRDITTKPEWWDAYSLTIPVLTFSRDESNTEVRTPSDASTAKPTF